MKLLEGKTALITGASKGIGKGIAEVFVAHGCNVAFTYLSSVEQAEAVEKELSAMVITLKEFRSTLLEANIKVFTDSHNLTFSNFSTQWVLCWHFF